MLNVTQEESFLYDFSTVQTLPSGLEIELDEWTTNDIGAVSTATGPSRVEANNKVLRKCKILSDPNDMYPFKEYLDGSRMLTGDRLVATILQRIFTHGYLFEFEWECGRVGCDKPMNDWVVDLRRLLLPYLVDEGGNVICREEDEGKYEDNPENMEWVETDEGPGIVCPRLGSVPIIIGDGSLKTKIFYETISEEALALWEMTQEDDKSNPTHTDRKGNQIEWGFLTGKEERELSKINPKNLKQLETQATRWRIKKILDKDGKKIIPQKFIEWVGNWSGRESQQFLAKVMSYEPGVNTNFSAVCRNCNGHAKNFIPTHDAAFFSPALIEKAY